jgi:hypothetical protein
MMVKATEWAQAFFSSLPVSASYDVSEAWGLVRQEIS